MELIAELLQDFWAVEWRNYLIRIAFAYFVAWIVHRLARPVTRRIANATRLASRHRHPLREERITTLQGLVASVISFAAFTTATLVVMNIFMEADQLVWLVGLFAAAFGLGARPLVSDYLTGIGFLFEDTFDVGEKVELTVPTTVQGVVEEVNLRTTRLRSYTGEVYTIPNGEIRVIRNFSRGQFSTADAMVHLDSADLNPALDLLSQLSHEAMTELPNLLEPWQILNVDGEIGNKVTLKIIAKTKYGKAAELRPRLLSLIQERFTAADINFAD